MTVQINETLSSIGDLGKRVEKNERRIDNIMDEIDNRIAAGLEKINLPAAVANDLCLLESSGPLPLSNQTCELTRPS